MNSDRLKKLKVYTLLSALTTLVGIVVLAFMIKVESEPGAIPLLLVVMGIGWYFYYEIQKAAANITMAR